MREALKTEVLTILAVNADSYQGFVYALTDVSTEDIESSREADNNGILYLEVVK